MTMALVQHRSNNFDAIRLLGAVLVLVGHAYPLHAAASNPGLVGVSIETLGLILFFSLSGYLITISWTRDRRIFSYLAKRALRIFPALIVVVALSMFVLGPVVTTLSPGQYFGSPGLFEYAKNVVLFPVYALPGAFLSNPYPGAVNGSLWSLPAEFACYLAVPLMFALPASIRGGAFLFLAGASGALSSIWIAHETHIVVWGTDLASAASVWPYFFAAAGFALLRDRFSLRLDAGFAALFTAGLLVAVSPAVGTPLLWFLLPYAVLSFGEWCTPILSRAGRFGDFSYGIYLYAFPVQQAVLSLHPELPFRTSVIVTLAVSVVLAVGSWHLIEKPALRFKPRAPSTVPTATILESASA